MASGVVFLATAFIMMAVPCIAGVVTDPGIEDPVGPPVCTTYKNNTLLMRFTAKLNADNITHVFANRTVGSDVTLVECSHHLLTDVNGTYLIVESLVDLNDLRDATATNPCGFTQELVSGNLTIHYRLALRRTQYFVRENDKDYIFSCVNSTAIGTHLVTDLTVLAPNILVDAPSTKPDVTLYIVNNATRATVQQCPVGEKLILAISMLIVQPYRDYLTPWGLYPYSTVFAATEADLNDPTKTRSLTVQNGCPVGNGLDMATGFKRDATLSNTSAAMYTSGVFECRRFLHTDTLWFATTYKLCQGLIGQDAKCIDYCASSRTKRSLTTNEQGDESNNDVIRLVTVLNIVGADGTNVDKHGDEGMTFVTEPAFIILMAVFCTLLVVMTAVIIVLCLRKERKRNIKDKDASASRSNLPMKF